MAKNLMVLYGINSILERLRCDPASIRKIFIERSFTHREIEGLIKAHGVRCDTVSERDLKRITRAKDFQKIVAKVERFTYVNFDELMERPAKTTLVFLDGINDPHNVGVIMRMLACFGNFAMVLPERGACSVNDTVMHVASGGENYVQVARVDDLKAALAQARAIGYSVYAALPSDTARDLTHITFKFPLALVMGAEAHGISTDLLDEVDQQITIPMNGATLSFNVNNACAIICYEITKQRKAVS
ncbi:MAG: RNA methyltransferase [Candidatus Omnitrophica bacterium]|nr:RNA methyltransferase [Candidatus Omnitrophota bacterium]